MIESLIVAFLQWGSANPTAIVQGANAVINAPRAVDVSKFEGFANMSKQILKCYHPTARYQSADVIETPWNRQDQYKASKSSLISIKFAGLTNTKYEMQVGLVEREDAVMTTVVQETAKIRASSKCQLENWTPIGAKNP